MARLQEIVKQCDQVSTMVNLTGAFEGIASIRISQIKNQVLQSQDFFSELWNMYTQIRVDKAFHYGRRLDENAAVDKELYIVLTAEGGFSGDIDEKLIDWMLTHYDPARQDIIVIGHHGAIQLAHRGINIVRHYKLPTRDENTNVTPIIEQVLKYKKTKAFYQTYVSLMVQDIKNIELRLAVQEQGREVTAGIDVITEENYIFEPSTYSVVDHLERSMLNIALSQIILESKLAQYASRFRAMSTANDKAKDSFDDVRMDYNRTKRRQSDQRLKESVNSMRKARI